MTVSNLPVNVAQQHPSSFWPDYLDFVAHALTCCQMSNRNVSPSTTELCWATTGPCPITTF